MVDSYEKNLVDGDMACRRQSVRVQIDTGCIVEPVMSGPVVGCSNGEVVDLSEGGLGICYYGSTLKKGDYVMISSLSQGILLKSAEVAWVFGDESSYLRAGLRWV